MKWKGDMKTNDFSIPVNITLKMLDETTLGVQSYKVKPDGQLLFEFICASKPQGKFAQDIEWVK